MKIQVVILDSSESAFKYLLTFKLKTLVERAGGYNKVSKLINSRYIKANGREIISPGTIHKSLNITERTISLFTINLILNTISAEYPNLREECYNLQYDYLKLYLCDLIK